MAESQNLKKKSLIFNVVEFLSGEINSGEMTEERKESIEVAIQCLETAYEISSDDKDSLSKFDLLSTVHLSTFGLSDEQIARAEHFKTLGNTSMKNNDYEDAVSQYTKAIETNPRNAVYFCNRAAAYSRLDNNEEAIKDCQQALILDPNYGKAYGRLGIAYSNLNRWPEAVRAYESSLTFDPHNATYQANLKLAQQSLLETMESAAPPEHRPIEFDQFINNEAFVSMAREMLANPDFQNIMSGIMAMSQSGETNFETLFQVGQNLAAQMQNQDPAFVENLRRQFEPQQPRPGQAAFHQPQGEEHEPPERDDGASGDMPEMPE